MRAKSTIPILDCALLKGDGSSLSVAATNLDQAVTSTIPCDAKGSCTASVSRLQAIASTLEKGVNVTMSVNGTGELTIKQDRARYAMPTLPVDDYPAVDEVVGAPLFAPSGDLIRSLRDLTGTVSKEQVHYYLCGVYFDTRDGSLVATNGTTLGREESTWVRANRDGFILPSAAIRPVCDLAALGDEVSITAGPNAASFSAKNVRLWTKYIDGQFPDWQRVVPKECPSVWRIKRLDLSHAIRQMAVVGGGGDYGVGIKFSLGASEVTLNASTPDISSAECTLPCERTMGKDLTICFGSRTIGWAVDALDGDEVIEMHAVDGETAAKLTPTGTSSALRVVMPMRVK